jgi:hypothetical protein
MHEAQDDEGQVNLEVVHADISTELFLFSVPLNNCENNTKNVTINLLCPPLSNACRNTDIDVPLSEDCLDPWPNYGAPEGTWVPCSRWANITDVRILNSSDNTSTVSLGAEDRRTIDLEVRFKRRFRSFGIHVEALADASSSSDNNSSGNSDTNSSGNNNSGTNSGSSKRSYVDLHVSNCLGMHVCENVCLRMCVCVCTRMYACVCVCVYAYMYVSLSLSP